MITFVEPTPHELWCLKAPTAIAVDGTVEVTLIVCADAPPATAHETPVVLYLDLEEAENLRSQMVVAAGRAKRQLQGIGS
jgi:hypothetical protein